MKEPLTNTYLSHHRIIEKIGAGGMGEVFLAQDTKLNRKVAIKFLNEEFSWDADKLNRSIQEAKAVSALNHPNILTVCEIGDKDDSNYIVTEFIAGKTLREQLLPKQTNSLNSILKIGFRSRKHSLRHISRDSRQRRLFLPTYQKVGRVERSGKHLSSF
jgi:serine/threonine protein kinase